MCIGEFKWTNLYICKVCYIFKWLHTVFQNMVLSKQTSTTVTMSPGMTSAIFQETLLAHILDLKSKALNVITSGPGASSIKTAQTHLFFIDDLNTAPKTGGMFTISHFVSYCLQGMCCYWNFFYHVETFSFRIMMFASNARLFWKRYVGKLSL